MFYKKQAKILFFSLMLLFVIGLSFFVFKADKQALARSFTPSSKAGDNFNGWAWSENYGWVSFNSSNCDADDDGSFDDVNSACSGVLNVNVSYYGVNVNYRTGALSGYAWSSNIGWISFDASGADVVYHKDTGKISGTAKIVALVGDGDLVFDGTATDLAHSHFGVETEISNEAVPAYGEFSGHAWNDNDIVNTGMGWLQFRGHAHSGDEYGVLAHLNHTPILDSYSVFTNMTTPSEEVLPTGTNVISVGDSIDFRATWTDKDINDSGIIFACKDGSGVDVGASTASNDTIDTNDMNNNWDCNGETWCTGTATTNSSLSCTNPNLAGTVGNQTYYTYVCDQFGFCEDMQSAQFLLNDQPIVGSVTAVADTNYTDPTFGYPLVTNNPLSSSDPYGNQDDYKLTFKTSWSDAYTDNTMSMFVCSGSGFNRDHDHLGCASGDTTWCENLDVAVTASGVSKAINCDGELQGSESSGVHDYYVFLCDGYDACSAVPATNKLFVNQRPVVATGMSAPNWNGSDAATNPADESDLQATLKWRLTDGDGTVLTDAYINLDKDDGTDVMDGFADPNLNPFAPTSHHKDFGNQLTAVCTGVGNVNCSLTIKDAGSTYSKLNSLNWNTSYRFAVSVRDEYAWSEPRIYQHGVGGTDVLTDDVAGYGANMNANENAVSSDSNYTFTTYKHNFPIANANTSSIVFLPGITYFPRVPSAGAEVKATPNSYRYADGEPSVGTDAVTSEEADQCTATNCSYDLYINNTPVTGVGELKNTTTGSWGDTLTNATIPITMKFFQEGDSANQDYSFTVIDSDGYFNTDNPASIDYVNEQLPSWQEIK